MTERQTELFNKLKEFIRTNGYTPSIREYGNYVGLSSPATVHHYFKIFQNAGKIKRVNRRLIEIIEE
jgi:repressor LexA